MTCEAGRGPAMGGGVAAPAIVGPRMRRFPVIRRVT